MAFYLTAVFFYDCLSILCLSTLCLQDTDNKESKEVFLTQGSYDVTDLVGYDQHLNNM